MTTKDKKDSKPEDKKTEEIKIKKEAKPDEADKVMKEVMEDDKKAADMLSIDKDKKEAKSDEIKENAPKVVGGIVVGLIVLVILLVVVMGVGMYKFNWNNQFIKWLPFPAAMVDGSFVSINDYQEDIDTLDFFYAAQSESIGTIPTDEYIQKTVISRMIREKYLSKYAATNNIEVTDEEVNTEYQVLIDQAGSEAEVNKQLSDLYNWTSDQFKEKVLTPYLIRTKIQEKLVGDDSESKAQAEEILEKIKNEEITFADAAKEYSEDVTASEGGELGYFSAGQMVPEFEAAAFALEVGEVSDVVQTDYGYHIIKLIERVEATEDQPEQLNAAHILIKTVDIDEWTNEKIADASVRLFINDYEWKDDCGLVLTKSETCDDNNLLDYLNSATALPTE